MSLVVLSVWVCGGIGGLLDSGENEGLLDGGAIGVC